MRLPAPLRLLVLLPLCVLSSEPAAAELWRWTDSAGVVRYTPSPERVPAAGRASLARVEPGMARVTQPVRPAAPAATEPSELYAPADEFSFEADPFNAPERARTLRGDVIPEPLEPAATSPLGAAEASPGVVAGGATAGPATPPVATAPPLSPDQRSRRAELEARIARDEERLKTLIASEDTRAGQPSQELREIAARLPELQAELRELTGGNTSSSDTPRP